MAVRTSLCICKLLSLFCLQAALAIATTTAPCLPHHRGCIAQRKRPLAFQGLPIPAPLAHRGSHSFDPHVCHPRSLHSSFVRRADRIQLAHRLSGRRAAVAGGEPHKTTAKEARAEGESSLENLEEEPSRGWGSFYLGLRGKGSRRGGALPHLPPHHGRLLVGEEEDPWTADPASPRFLVAKGQQHLQEAFATELSLYAHARRVEGALWQSSLPAHPLLLLRMPSLRLELAPLLGPFSSARELVSAVTEAKLSCNGWALYHERIERHVTDKTQGLQLAAKLSHAIGGEPDTDSPSLLLVVLEQAAAFTLCVATSSPADQPPSSSPSPHQPPQASGASVLLGAFRHRPFTFAAALEPVLAAVAANVLRVGPNDLLLDPCCGTGTNLLAGLERGATVRGLDILPKFVIGARRNMEAFGHVTLGGGALRLPACPARCVVALHDARDPLTPFPSLLPRSSSSSAEAGAEGEEGVTVVIANLPHGRYLQLPYAGYVRDMISNLLRSLPNARLCLISGAGAMHDDGPDNLQQVLREEGLAVWHVTNSKKMRLTFAYRPRLGQHAAAEAASAAHESE